MNYRKIAMALAMSALFNLATVANAQKDARSLGTSKSGFSPAVTKQIDNGVTYLTALYTNASYGTGGVALRNRLTGAIHISGVSGPTQAAWLYWAVLLQNPTATQVARVGHVTIARQFPTGAPLPSSTTLNGTLIAVGGDPCWGSTGTYVFRAQVPNTIATGNGLYKVILRGATGLTDGEDPWDFNVVFPLFEGASLVVVGTGTANVGLLDGQAGTTFVGTTFSNYYQLPATTASGSRVLLDNFGYDGQIGASRSIFSPTSNETSSVSGYPSLTFVQVAGPGGETSNSDWDGSSGWPLPQLWDDTGYDISNAFAAGDTFVLVNYTSGNDCIGTVGAVISVQ
ncbi:MAG TPA: hypothetical protein VKD23_09180 [Terriglobales bacterium]|nr:hypothetical protein [Terriglobales bacterium]